MALKLLIQQIYHDTMKSLFKSLVVLYNGNIEFVATARKHSNQICPYNA
jgi:hypothetical protein